MFWQNDEIILIVAGTIMLLLLGIFITGFLFFYQKKHNSHIAEQELLHSTFRQELLKTQIEVQEQTLNNISREIHDNINQVLSFVKLSLALTDTLDESEKQKKINECRDLVAQTINDLRNLSKSMSFEHIEQLGLVKALEIEVARINSSGLINAVLVITGDPYPFGGQRELVLFRIFQESLNNTLKHAAANHLKISLQYSNDLFNLTVADDGVGFSARSNLNQNGSGLKNIENRAALIGAVAIIDSSPGNGCYIKVTLNPLEEQLYADGNHPDRFS